MLPSNSAATLQQSGSIFESSGSSSPSAYFAGPLASALKIARVCSLVSAMGFRTKKLDHSLGIITANHKLHESWGGAITRPLPRGYPLPRSLIHATAGSSFSRSTQRISETRATRSRCTGSDRCSWRRAWRYCRQRMQTGLCPHRPDAVCVPLAAFLAVP